MSARALAQPVTLPDERASSARLLFVLARFEARKVLLHPLTLVATAALGLVFGMGVVEASRLQTPGEGIGYSTWGAALFAWFMVLAGNLAALRGVSAKDMVEASPTARRMRTAASLIAMAAPAAAVAVLALALDVTLAVAAPQQSILRGPYGVEGALVVARSLLTIAVFGGFGVAVARHVPHPLAGGVAFLASLQASEHPLHPMAGGVTDTTTTLVWAIPYVAGIGLLVAAAALARDADRRLIAPVATVGAALVCARLTFA